MPGNKKTIVVILNKFAFTCGVSQHIISKGNTHLWQNYKLFLRGREGSAMLPTLRGDVFVDCLAGPKRDPSPYPRSNLAP